jgi:ribose-phosphate pyrophosphokinase
VANLIVAAGANRVLTMDLHAAQIQGFFDIPVDHLVAAPVFAEFIESIRDQLGECVLLSPDVGNVKTANMYANYIGGDLAIIDKRRKSGSEVESANLVGDVRGKTVLMFDDMISTAGTICAAAEVVMGHGAKRVLAAATHPVLVGLAMERLAESPIDPVVVGNTIQMGDRCEKLKDKLKVLTVAPLLGEAIHRIHRDQSISALFKKGLNGKR